MKFLGSCIINARRFFCRRKQTQIYMSPSDIYLSHPLSIDGTDAFVTGAIFSTSTAILFLLGSGSLAQIYATIVQAIMIYVIASWSANRCVHIYSALPGLMDGACRVVGIRNGMRFGIPVPLREKIKVFNIDNGRESTRQRNDPKRLIKWLCDLISGDVVFAHMSLRKRILAWPM